MAASRLLLAFVACLALACAAPRPTVGPAATPAGDRTPAPAPGEDPTAFKSGEFVEIAHGVLAVRDAPNTAAPILEEVPRPATLHVESSLSAPDGVWYRVQYRWARVQVVFGWVLDERAGSQLRAIALGCPARVDDVANLAGLLPAELLRCLRGGPVTLHHVVLTDAPPAQPLFVGSPAWLASESRFWSGA